LKEEETLGDLGLIIKIILSESGLNNPCSITTIVDRTVLLFALGWADTALLSCIRVVRFALGCANTAFLSCVRGVDFVFGCADTVFLSDLRGINVCEDAKLIFDMICS
jgi:hypothetical protein